MPHTLPPRSSTASALRTVTPAPPAGAAPRLLSAADYLSDVTLAIASARRRVCLTALTVSRDELTEGLVGALVDAAARGVDVRVSADVFTYVAGTASIIGAAVPSPRRRDAARLERDLQEAGGTMRWLGAESGLPFRGRTHTKLTVVDDVVWTFGGVNMDAAGVTNVDYMLRLDDAPLAETLAALHDAIAAEAPRERMAAHVLDHQAGRVLIDGGRPGESAIYATALAWARQAERVLHVSQYCPTGPLGREVSRRADGLWFNSPRHAAFANATLIASSMATTGHRTRYRRDRYLHAKALVFTMPDGERVAITGSHNFVCAGVRLGTREIALETRDPRVIDQIERFHAEHVRADALVAHTHGV